MGVSTCTFEARSAVPAEVKDAVFTHFVKYHSDKAAKLTDKDKADMSLTMDKKIG
jgi:predicted small metal-binding protein